ncbi:hypothetical protein HAX54_047053, partial [Datura stramonium]|nr:hypothetical protein [Datura stramonium]
MHLHLLVNQRHQLDRMGGMVLPLVVVELQTRTQTRAQANPQPEIVNGGHPRVAAPERVQEQVFQDAPATVPAGVPTVALPTDVVMRLSNVLEALVSNH